MQTFARNPKSSQFQFSRILNFQPHKIWPQGEKCQHKTFRYKDKSSSRRLIGFKEKSEERHEKKRKSVTSETEMNVGSILI